MTVQEKFLSRIDDIKGFETEKLLNNEFERLKTFPLNWNRRYSKIDLVNCGFYYDALKKVAICAACSQVLIGLHYDCFPCGSACALIIEHSFLNKDCPNCNKKQQKTLLESFPTNCGDMRFEKNRLISYLATNWTSTVDPSHLAKWGFYRLADSRNDSVICEFCKLVVGKHDMETISFMHKKTNCPLLGKLAVGNIKLEQDKRDTLSTNCSKLSLEGMDNSQELLKHPNKEKTDASYETITSRLSTFSTWPYTCQPRPKCLAEAGFLYLGVRDYVKCFCCRGILKSWRTGSSPWVQHARFFPACLYVKIQMGVQFIAQVQRIERPIGNNYEPFERKNIFHDTWDGENCSPNGAKKWPTDPNLSFIDPISTMYNLVRPCDSDKHTCVICCALDINNAFVPCGHLITCHGCAKLLSVCPLCRSVIKCCIKVYMPF